MSTRTIVKCLLVSCLLLQAGSAWATGAASSDRFGYTGTVVRYGSMDDALSQTNAVGTYAIGNRDLSLYVVDDLSSYDADANIVMGSWWYSTAGSAGWGNTRGNSGRGFLQLYDADGSTDSLLAMGFHGFDGTHYTQFSMLLSGQGADYGNDYARFWIDYQGGGSDQVIFHQYALAMTAGGLEGTDDGSGLIQSSNQPTSVTGSFTGIFENVSTSYNENNGFYAFELDLDMTNWAWENQSQLDPYAFADSYFAAPAGNPLPVVPEPMTMLAFGSAVAGLGGYIRRRRRA
jgi:hypothetical protein